MIIGRNFLVKINANIGNSAVASSIEEEVEKMRWATQWGADTLMDLSTGKIFIEQGNGFCETVQFRLVCSHLSGFRKSKWKARGFNLGDFSRYIIEQAEQGVDYLQYMQVCFYLMSPLTSKRMTGIVSRGGSIMAKWCLAHHRENFLYENWDEICQIMAAYDIFFR